MKSVGPNYASTERCTTEHNFVVEIDDGVNRTEEVSKCKVYASITFFIHPKFESHTLLKDCCRIRCEKVSNVA